MRKTLETRIKEYTEELDTKARSFRALGGYSGAATYEEVAAKLRELLREHHNPES